MSTATSTPLTAQIEELVADGEVSMPPLPELIVKLESLLADEDGADIKDVVALVSHDPAVTAAILKLANSAAYGGLQPIAEVSPAVARIGLRQVRVIANAMSHKKHYETDDPERRVQLTKLWDHAVAAGVAARRLAIAIDADVEEAFLAGMLHDTGKLLVLRCVTYLESNRSSVDVTPDLLDELMDAMHTKLGHSALTDWKLPESVCRAALEHHDPESDHETVLIVQAADAMSRKLGHHLVPDPEIDLSQVPEVCAMNMSEVELAAVMIDVEDDLAEFQSVLR